jgi:hypothetical protein
MSGADKYFDQGDLIVSPKLREPFPFCVECKHRKIFRLESLFTPSKEFLDYHRQVLSACEREGNCRIPMVVVRGQRGSILASVPAWVIVGRYGLPKNSTAINYPALGSRWLMTDLDSFLQGVFANKGCIDSQSST